MFEGDLPEAYPEINAVVVAKVNISKSYDGSSTSLRVEKITPLEIVRQEHTKRVEIHISARQNMTESEMNHQKGNISKIAQLISSHPGPTQVRVNLNYERVAVNIKPGKEGVTLTDELFQSLKKLDPDTVRLSCH